MGHFGKVLREKKQKWFDTEKNNMETKRAKSFKIGSASETKKGRTK